MTPPAAGSDAAERVVHAATCLGCGCTCDDIDVVIRGGRIVEAGNACTLGIQWFGDGVAPARVRAQGRDVSRDEGLNTAAALLLGAARPLVYLAPDVSCETQREVVACADFLRATLDSVTSATAMSSILASQERGRVSATLGEIRNRADVVVFWGVDPSVTSPRYWSRYAPEPVGVHIPAGRRSRTVIAVDIGNRRGPQDADVHLSIEAIDEVDTLVALAALLAKDSHHGGDGAAWDRARSLAPLLAAGRYSVIVADAECDPTGGVMQAHGLAALAQALNATTRGALSLLRAGGNRTGADAVMTWQTGYPTAVDFGAHYPTYDPHGAGRWACDAVLVVGSAGLIPSATAAALLRAPAILIGPRASESAFAGGAAVFDAATAGIHAGGTAVRMDDVPLPLTMVLPGPPDATDLCRDLRERCRAGRA